MRGIQSETREREATDDVAEDGRNLAKNTMMGIHIAITLPPTDVEIIAPTTPVETIQLQSMARTNSVTMPPMPCSL